MVTESHDSASRLSRREVRRPEDDELCGYVDGTERRFRALTVFLGVLAEFESEEQARQHVADHGLASLHERWQFRATPDAEWQTVLIQEARPGWVRLVLGYYSLPGVPTIELAMDEASQAEVVLPR